MIGCCVCCSALLPRYKRLVDNIFPVDPDEGLVKANMDKLIFYSLSSPEKLDRIGDYLYQKASRDINRRRYGFVIIAMDAMDRLLKASHAKTLNVFGHSFLKMIQRLLESSEPQLQILATHSFVHFANIEEDTPSYHRSYDFFVSKFSSMCHSSHKDTDTRNQLRLAGVQGLQGVVRKTVSDDLVENIWNKQHMDKIVPSLLFNLQNCQTCETNVCMDSRNQEVLPPVLAEECLREVVGRASFGHIHCVLKPVLRHLDSHQLWVPNTFAIRTFRTIMSAIQVQYSYTVVEALMTHLDENSESNPKIRTSIADVLSKIIAIAAGESVGPSVLEIINSLMSNLKKSVSRNVEPTVVENQYQESLINALGEFANHLPDYQKIEIMMFIMNKVPYPCRDLQKSDVLLQSILLKSLLKVATKYRSVHLDKTFQLSFLEPLLKMACAPDAKMRVLVQNIFHTLLDRHKNGLKLSEPSIDITTKDLNLEQSSRSDIIFINKHGSAIYSSLYNSLQLDDTDIENVKAVYTTLALICIELASNETIVDYLQLILSIQQMAIANPQLTPAQRYHITSLTIAVFNMVPQVLSVSPLREYSEKIIEARRTEAPYLLPPLLSHYDSSQTRPLSSLQHLMIDQNTLIEGLKLVGVDGSSLKQLAHFAHCPITMNMGHRHSWVEAGTSLGSATDLSSLNNDVDSAASSPGLSRKINTEEYSFDVMKRAVNEQTESEQLLQEEQYKRLAKAFRNETFDELLTRTKPQHELLRNKLNDIFSSLKFSKNLRGVNALPSNETLAMEPTYETHFPELFIH